MKTAKINGIEIAVCGLRELQQWANARVSHVVPIAGALDANCIHALDHIRTLFPQATLYPLFFDDVGPEGRFPATADMIRQTLDFTATLRAGDRLLVQCIEGISRSSAIAFATLCQHWGAGFEIECYIELKWIRPAARPNALVVKLADSILGRCREMVKAIDDNSAR